MNCQTGDFKLDEGHYIKRLCIVREAVEQDMTIDLEQRFSFVAPMNWFCESVMG